MNKPVTLLLATLLAALSGQLSAEESVTMDGKQYSTIEVNGQTYLIPDNGSKKRGARSLDGKTPQQTLRRGERGLKVIMMCEIPSNALLADKFLEHVDGFSIGSNDMTQLTLGLDRDSGLIAHLFDERNEAVKALLAMAIQAARKAGKYVGICGQGPSDHPDFAAWLVEQGIDSVSLNPDTVVDTWLYLAEQHGAK